MDTYSTLAVAQELARASESINDCDTFDETLDAIVHATRASLPEFGHVSISVRNGSGAFETSAGTDQVAWELDSVQYDLGEGPCVQAIEAEPVVVVQHLRHDQRWPRYVAAAAAKGVRSQVAVRLFTKRKHVAGLNLYSTERDDVDACSAETARLFAAHAAIILGHAQEEDQLNRALQNRKTIGQAVGILMERYRIDADRAFQFLVRASSTSNIKLRDVAEEVVTSSVERYRADG
jgi:GAF domain-containing protein